MCLNFQNIFIDAYPFEKVCLHIYVCKQYQTEVIEALVNCVINNS